MAPNLLVLGGTTEAAALCRALQAAGLRGTVSLAGRVARPAPLALPTRLGGFGGVEGLVAYLRSEAVSHVIDATHPFAAGMSANAVAACEAATVPLIALSRPAWVPVPGDRWLRVPDIAGAVAALDRPPARILLAIGRQNLGAFVGAPQHAYLLRLVDPPAGKLPLPKTEVVVARGPFTEAGDAALLQAHRIELVVSKNSGGAAAYGKLAAARRLGLPVVMIDRPTLPARREVFRVEDVLGWLRHASTDLGV